MMFQNKVALVTGGSSGIGEAAALIFAREGAKVALACRSRDSGERVVARIKNGGGDAVFIQADVTSEAQVAAMVADTVKTFGRLDTAFNNAGHPGMNSTLVDCTQEEWNTVFDVNVRGAWLSMKYEIPQMRKQGGGSIVVAASGLSLFSSPRMAAYTAAKHAVIGLVRSAAMDYSAENIRVNALLPGATLTPLLTGMEQGKHVPLDEMAAKVPMRRLSSPEEQAEVAVFLCSDRASYISGESVMVDGGLAVKRW